LSCLAPDGFILIDDVIPFDEVSSLPSAEDSARLKRELGISHGSWYGDVYKVLGAIAQFHPELGCEPIGDDEAHVQAVVWKLDESLPTEIQERAHDAIAFWKYQDFFPSSDLCNVLPLESERESLARVRSLASGRRS
jgi:hypothetical protein